MTLEDIDLEQFQATWAELQALARYSPDASIRQKAQTAANKLGHVIDEIVLA